MSLPPMTRGAGARRSMHDCSQACTAWRLPRQTEVQRQGQALVLDHRFRRQRVLREHRAQLFEPAAAHRVEFVRIGAARRAFVAVIADAIAHGRRHQCLEVGAAAPGDHRDRRHLGERVQQAQHVARRTRLVRARHDRRQRAVEVECVQRRLLRQPRQGGRPFVAQQVLHCSWNQALCTSMRAATRSRRRRRAASMSMRAAQR